MKVINSLLFTVLLCNFTFANSLVQQADSAYNSQNYSLAIQLYTQLIGNNNISAELYYNLGNTYYKYNENGKAIWAYQKAKKIDPSNNDINYNLAFVSKLTKDKITQNNIGVKQWIEALIYGQPINFWAYISLLLSALSALFIYFYRHSIHAGYKSMLFYLSVFLCTLMTLTIIVSYSHKNRIISINNGIIIEAVAKVYTSPNSEEKVAFELHEGAKFEILKTDDEWINIQINQNHGWLKKSTVLLY